MDKTAPLLETKPQIQKQEPIIGSPLEKVDMPIIKTPTLDDKLDELLAKTTASKTKTEVTDTLNTAPKRMEISPPLQNPIPAIANAPLYQRLNLSKESLMADMAYREVVKQVDELGTALGKDLTKRADDWRKHIHALDAYIKSLQGLPWTKMLSYSACFLLVVTFMWKMGALRVLPDFLSTAIKLIPTPGITSTTITAITESPVAVFGIVAGVSMGLMKIAVLALKRLPK